MSGAQADLVLISKITQCQQEMRALGLIEPEPLPVDPRTKRTVELDFFADMELTKEQKSAVSRYIASITELYRYIRLQVMILLKTAYPEDKVHGADIGSHLVGLLSTELLGHDFMAAHRQIAERVEHDEDTLAMFKMQHLPIDKMSVDIIGRKYIDSVTKWLGSDSIESMLDCIHTQHTVIQNIQESIATLQELSTLIQTDLHKTQSSSSFFIRKKSLYDENRQQACLAIKAIIDTLEFISTQLLAGKISPDEAIQDHKGALCQLVGNAGIEHVCNKRRSAPRSIVRSITNKTPEKVRLLAQCIQHAGITVEEITQKQSHVPHILQVELSKVHTSGSRKQLK